MERVSNNKQIYRPDITQREKQRIGSIYLPTRLFSNHCSNISLEKPIDQFTHTHSIDFNTVNVAIVK